MAIINGIQNPQIDEKEKQKLEKQFLDALPKSCCEWKITRTIRTYDVNLETPVLVFELKCLKCGSQILHKAYEKEIKE